MKITPLEIRKKVFEKQLRGYDKEEVNAFLLSLSHEWENALEQIKTFETQLKKSQEEVDKLRDVEASLYKTLKTAEDTGANMIDQAKRAADLHLKETQMNADALLNESKSKARNIIEDAEVRAKQILESMEDELKELARVYHMLEDHRDGVLNELTNLSTVTLQRVQKVSDNLKHFDIEARLKEIRKSSDEDLNSKKKIDIKPTSQPPKPKPEEMIEDNEIMEEESTGPSSAGTDGSFFDELD
ncbi:MAG: DivIVA domain-containing protein [Cyclobacteriaceae bacterium]|nr:DivIVA domain-containing protein [Cyclobacteriaceae bacterium]